MVALSRYEFLKDQKAKKDAKDEEVMIELLPLTIKQKSFYSFPNSILERLPLTTNLF